MKIQQVLSAFFGILAICLLSCGSDAVDNVTGSFAWPHSGHFAGGNGAGKAPQAPIKEDSKKLPPDEAEETLQYYSGTVYREDMSVRLQFCFSLRPEKVDSFANDPE